VELSGQQYPKAELSGGILLVVFLHVATTMMIFYGATPAKRVPTTLFWRPLCETCACQRHLTFPETMHGQNKAFKHSP
jgi:hypothetical protein